MVLETLQVPKSHMVDETPWMPRSHMVRETLQVPRSPMVDGTPWIPRSHMVHETLQVPRSPMVDGTLSAASRMHLTADLMRCETIGLTHGCL